MEIARQIGLLSRKILVIWSRLYELIVQVLGVVAVDFSLNSAGINLNIIKKEVYEITVKIEFDFRYKFNLIRPI